MLSAAWNVDATCRFKILPAGTHVSNTNTDKRESNGNGSTTVANKPNHKETADRLDMPPPPSPASSTCSDTGSITTSHSKIQLKIICLIVRKQFKKETRDLCLCYLLIPRNIILIRKMRDFIFIRVY